MNAPLTRPSAPPASPVPGPPLQAEAAFEASFRSKAGVPAVIVGAGRSPEDDFVQDPGRGWRME